MTYREIVEYAGRQGFFVESIGYRVRFRHPQGGRMVVTSRTSRDYRGNQNALADLKRVMRELGIRGKEKS